MSDRNVSHSQSLNGSDAANGLDLRERSIVPPGLGFWGKVWFWVKFWLFVKTARLRFIALLIAIGGVIAYWDTLLAYYDKWARPRGDTAVVVGTGDEFWCPMHPPIVRDKPDKCPICGMPLSKRKKGEGGEPEPLPPGVVSRVQLTPYRVALAGIQTVEVEHRPLSREISTVGFVEFDEQGLARISARVTGKSRIDKLFVNVTGQLVQKGDPLALLYSPDLVVTVQNLLDANRSSNRELQRMARDRLQLWGIEKDQVDDIVRTGRPITQVTIRAPISGYVLRKYQVEGEYVEEGARLYDVADLTTVWIEAQVYEDELALLREGLAVTATTRAFPNREFTGKLAFLHPHLDPGTRTLRVRFNMPNPKHELRPGMYATVRVQIPATQLDMFSTVRQEEWQHRVVVDMAARALRPAGGNPIPDGLETLLHAAVEHTVARHGLVLTVPERAVIDTGNRYIVYRESGPGTYEGVVVQLGPRSGAYYPVVRGLQAGDRVAAAGSFLIDAETRLTAGVVSTYFGASGGPQDEQRSGVTTRPSMNQDDEGKVKAALARLSAADRRLAEAQRFCAILSDSRLGSMGVPIKLVLKDRPVFVCCKGCVAEARADEEATLARAQSLRERTATPPKP